MKIRATITKLNPVVERVTERGNLFRCQDITLAWKETSEDGRILEQSFCTTLKFEQLLKFEQMGCKVGDEITVEMTICQMFSQKTGVPYNSIGVYVMN